MVKHGGCLGNGEGIEMKLVRRILARISSSVVNAKVNLKMVRCTQRGEKDSEKIQMLYRLNLWFGKQRETLLVLFVGMRNLNGSVYFP